MTLVKFNPMAHTTGFTHFKTLDRLMHEIFADDHNVKANKATPAVNIIENESLFKLEVAAPGLAKEDFKINVEDKTLTVSAEKKIETETKEGEKTLRREFGYSNFKRTFTLPENVNAADIKAVYENGVLNVHLPKVEVKKVVQTIDIQ
jgi:HSP20 family protein